MRDVERVKLAIDGMEYHQHIPEETIEYCQANGIYIIYGASDDLLEVDGFFREEFDAYNGLNSKNLEYYDDGGDINYVIKALKDNEVIATWCPNPEVSWSIECTPYHTADTESFDIMEDGEVFCQGLILQYPAEL